MAGSCFFVFLYEGGWGYVRGQGQGGEAWGRGGGFGGGNTKALTAQNEGHRWHSLRISDEILSSGPLESLL